MLDAAELFRRAQDAQRAGRLAAALGLLDRAEAARPEPGLAARIELTRSYVESETGRREDGLARCHRLLGSEGLDDELRGLVHAQLGLLHVRLGDTAEAMASFARALDVLPSGHPELGRVLLNRGNVHLAHVRPHAAVSDFTAAREAFAVEGLELQRAKAQHNLGYARLLTGDLVGALRQMEQAALVLAPMSPVSRAVSEQDRAEVLLAAGRPREAARALEEASAAYGQRRLRTFQADCELALAWTVLREDPARSRLLARRAARRFLAQASPVRALQAEAAATVAEIATGRRTPSLLARADRLAADLHDAGHRRDAEQVRLQAARVAVARGDLADASGRLQRVRPGVDSPVAVRLLDREVRAELAAARGARRRAHAHVRAGLADLHAWQSSFGSLDLQSTLVGHGRSLALHGLRLALADGSPELVLEWSERARALVGRVAPVRPPADEQLAADLAELRSLPGSAGRRTPEGQRAAALRDRVRQHSWYAAGDGRVGEPADLATLTDALAADDAALVAHLSLDGRLAAVVVTAQGTHVVGLGTSEGLRGRLDGLAADLTMAAEHRTGGLAGAVRGSLGRRLAQEAEQLVAPLVGLVGDRRVVLTPSGDLAGTPWPLLPGLAGRPLTVAPSATRWLALRALPATHERVGLVAGPRLERAEEEVTRAASRWSRSEVLCGPDSTAEAVSALAARVDVLHLAGHGAHQGENPLFAAVELADGPWYGYDVDRLASVPSTVVLSACELGRASVRSGEESVGMTAAWLHAGARTVVSAPVEIADDVACEALAQWHAAVARGVPPADALAGLDVGDVVPLVCAGAGW